MRKQLEELGTPNHLALAYDAWARTDPSNGKVPDDTRARWLADIADIVVDPDYARSFDRWKNSFTAEGDRVVELSLTSRLLVGHGNTSATDVGITVHHTWGVPFIPGSALKGLVAHYVEATYGPADPDKMPWDQQGEEHERARYQGVTWKGSRIERGPGDIYRALFGAPVANSDDEMRKHALSAGATSGLVTFHDALYVPGSIVGDKPFAADVLTVHQKGYYDSSGKSPPNDYDSPNPVAFVTVRPGCRLLFALSGLPEWTMLAERLLCDSLSHWGVGGKTSAGYGRIEQVKRRRGGGPIPQPGTRIDAELLAEKTKKNGWRVLHWSSGLEGAIINSADVPAEHKAGDVISVVVASVKGNQSGFRFVSDTAAKTTKGSK
jgi:CRISPR-associated protein Cmr6